MTVATIHADRVSEGLASHGVDAVVTFHMPNVRWLSGFTGSNAATIVGPGLRIFVTDSRYLSQSAEQVDEGWQRHIAVISLRRSLNSWSTQHRCGWASKRTI
jgi:hypothetical protein